MKATTPIRTPEKGIFRSGTSNVVVPERNKAAFPPAYRSKSHLEYYASLFNSVEINRTFYKLPMPVTMGKWAVQVPEDFQFTVKLWKEITHVKELNYKPADVATFMKTVAPIGDKKGCLLVQFPASLSVQYADSMERLLADITLFNPSPDWRLAIEFRNAGWYDPAVYAVLDRYKTALVLHDKPLPGTAARETGRPSDEKASPMGAAFASNNSFIFRRYHGPQGDYKGSYSPVFLEHEAAAIRTSLSQSKDVYAYFNNTAEGDAPKDLIRLNRLVNEQH